MKTLNPLTIYYDTGYKCGLARRRHDESLAHFHSNWLNRALALEPPEHRQTIRDEFNRGYNDGR